MSSATIEELKDMARAAMREADKLVGRKTYEEGIKEATIKYSAVLERKDTEHNSRVDDLQLKLADAEHRINRGTKANENLQERLRERTTELALAREERKQAQENEGQEKGEVVLFKGSYKQALKWCKENKVKVILHEGVKGGHRLQVVVPKECKMHGEKLYPGMRTIRINRPPEKKEVAG